MNCNTTISFNELGLVLNKAFYFEIKYKESVIVSPLALKFVFFPCTAGFK